MPFHTDQKLRKQQNHTILAMSSIHHVMDFNLYDKIGWNYFTFLFYVYAHLLLCTDDHAWQLYACKIMRCILSPLDFMIFADVFATRSRVSRVAFHNIIVSDPEFIHDCIRLLYLFLVCWDCGCPRLCRSSAASETWIALSHCCCPFSVQQ